MSFSNNNNLGANTDFNIVSSVPGSTNYSISSQAAKDVVSIQVSTLGVVNSSDNYSIDFSATINQVVYNQQNDLHYFAGQFAGKAAVEAYDGTNQTLVFTPVQDSWNGNEITGIVEDDGNVYAIANIYGQGNFGVGNIIAQGSEEAVILASDGSSVFHMLPAGAQNRVSANDIEMDMVGDLWVALEFEQKVTQWSTETSALTTAMVVNFTKDLDAKKSYLIHEDRSPGLQSASANALSFANNQLYVSGTFFGDLIAIGNNDDGFTNTSSFSGSQGTSDLWIAKISIGNPVFSWIEGSNSDDPIYNTDVEFDGKHAYSSGSYNANISFGTGMVNLSHPQQYQNYNGFVVRGDDFRTGGNSGAFYKTDLSASNNNENDSEIDDVDLVSNSIIVYPNPNNGEFSLKFQSSVDGEIELTIFDVTGRVVLNNTFSKTGTEFIENINLNNFNSGIYMVAIQLNGEVAYQKFIIQ